MNRFDEDFDRDMTVIAERVTPSPDAWAEIQQRIADRAPHQETEIIMLTDNTFTRRRWPLVTAAAAVIALAITGIALVNRGDDIELPAAPPVPTVAPDAIEPEAVEPQVVEPEVDSAEDLVAETGPIDLPSPGTSLAPGRYTGDSLGVPIEFDVDSGQTAAWMIESVDPGTLWIRSVGSDQEFIAIGRVGSWFNATEARSPNTTGLGSLPADDLDGWIKQNGINVVDSGEVEVGGRPAQYRQFLLDTSDGASSAGCGDPCLWAITGSPDVPGGAATPIPIGQDRVHTIWQVDMGEFEPVYIYAAAILEDDEQWVIDIVQPIVDSITFGDPAPVVPGGTARVPERRQVFASYSGTRSVGEQLEDGTREVTASNTIEGDLIGEMVSTGIEVTPANGYDDLVFTGTIEGLGTGTLTMYQEWTGSGNGDIALTTFVTGGTGDFAGFTGRVFTSVDAPDESGPEPIYSGRMTFELAVPRSG